MHIESYNKMVYFRNTFLDDSISLNILDVGSLDLSGKNFNYKNIFSNSNWKYVGLDFQKGDNVDIQVKDIYNWLELSDNSFDVVISGHFFEHLEYFWLTMSEIDRVLKSGGYCCIISSSSGKKQMDSTKDCYRFQKDGMRVLAKYVNFKVLEISTNIDSPYDDICLIAKKY